MRTLPCWIGAVGLVLIGAIISVVPAWAASTSAPVVVCDHNSAWRHPSPEAMARTIWRDPRYVDPRSGTVSPAELGFYNHPVLAFRQTSAAAIRRALDLGGLAGAQLRLCPPGAQESADIGNPLMLWLVENTLQGASREGDTLRLTVTPGSGYTILEVPRTALIEVATENGQEMARIDLANLTGDCFMACAPRTDRAFPPGLPHPANGRAVLDGADSLHVEMIDGRARATYARYLVPVAPGTTPREILRQYAAALQAAGFQVDPIAVDPEAEALAFTFAAGPSSPSAVAAGRVTVPRDGADTPDAVQISVFLAYKGAPGHLPASGGPPTLALPVSGLLGLAFLVAGLTARRKTYSATGGRKGKTHVHPNRRWIRWLSFGRAGVAVRLAPGEAERGGADAGSSRPGQ